ncbi:MAG: transcriptional regulator [Acidimicrobiales bacterium]|nr:transcriptional regulator [Acidimicrobiales bacterium]
MDEADADEATDDYSRRVGERLRGIRRQKRCSLHDVEHGSGQEFKASVLGAYERGERSISVPRLQRLAEFYDVPVDQLLPVEDAAEVIDLTDRAIARHAETQLVIDLQVLVGLTGAEGAMLNRFVRTIQVQRQDFNGRMLTIRRDDARAIACILGVSTDQVVDRLDRLGLTSIGSAV